ncbi:MAG: hypothetical protein Q4D09_08120 [Clostridia bacterium]|nr:hypothetical protein [Clostridia bacterium]
MAKKISIFLAALMVLTLFTAIAMAAVNVEVCPTCNQGEMRDSTVRRRVKVGTVECSTCSDQYDTVYVVRLYHYTGCNNLSCSACVFNGVEDLYTEVECGHK